MRSLMCGLLTRVATVIGSLTLAAFVLMTVTLDPGRPARVLDGLLESDAGRQVAVQVLASQVIERDPKLTHAQATALAQRVVSDPRLPQALEAAEHGGPEATVNAVLASVKRYDPAAAAAITKYLPHTTTGAPAVKLVPTSVSTSLFRFRGDLERGVFDGLVLAIALAVAALLLGPRRDRVLRRLGWWCIGASVFQVAFWVGLPRLLDQLDGQWPVLVAVAIRAAGSTVVGVLVTLLLVGAALLAVGHLGPRLRPLIKPLTGRDPNRTGPSPTYARTDDPNPMPFYGPPSGVSGAPLDVDGTDPGAGGSRRSRSTRSWTA